MSQTAIDFADVSKRFFLHKVRQRTLQEILIDILRPGGSKRCEYWVLRDMSFTVQRGETVGIIGSNGSGKSTILKLISRILEPTQGVVKVHGRVAALLELGSGFHPDLSGRENIYLNGSILNLSQREITRRIDEIVNFSELDDFIDVPVKHYSSGMYVRLGFSVAIHMQPDILLVDEVLTVGDAAFQRKCIDRIYRLRDAGVTILLVSHDPSTISRICTRAIWVKDGRLCDDGSPTSVIRSYTTQMLKQENAKLRLRRENASATPVMNQVHIVQVNTLDDTGNSRTVFVSGEALTIVISYLAITPIAKPVFGLAIHRSDGVHIMGPNSLSDGYRIPLVEGEGEVRYRIPDLALLQGDYLISLSVHDEDNRSIYCYHSTTYPFSVINPTNPSIQGLLRIDGEWTASQGIVRVNE